MLILTSIATRGTEVLAGDGETIDILLTPSDAAKTVWRLTHFSAERLTPEITATGSRLQIVSPDAAELIVLSSDPSVGGRLSLSAQRFARQAGTRSLATGQRIGAPHPRAMDDGHHHASFGSRDALRTWSTSPRRTLADAEPMYRAGDIDASLRMARRADAWALRSEWQLAEALMPNWPSPTSCPPMDLGAAEIQSLWRPLMDDEGWGINRLTSGSLDSRRPDRHRPLELWATHGQPSDERSDARQSRYLSGPRRSTCSRDSHRR